jgi:hypothetical protein
MVAINNIVLEVQYRRTDIENCDISNREKCFLSDTFYVNADNVISGNRKYFQDLKKYLEISPFSYSCVQHPLAQDFEEPNITCKFSFEIFNVNCIDQHTISIREMKVKTNELREQDEHWTNINVF